MKLREQGSTLFIRILVLWALAIGLPKVVFMMQAEERHEVSTKTAHVFVEGSSLGLVGSPYHRNIVLITNQIPCHEKSKDLSLSSLEDICKCVKNITGTDGTIHKIMVPFLCDEQVLRRTIKHVHFLPSHIELVVGLPKDLVDEKHWVGYDAICLAIQDTGIRTDGYVSVVYNALGVAHKFGKELIIIDHPNPLGGSMEGVCSGSQDISDETLFLARIPLRHGMTLGELARYMNRALFSSPARLSIVPLKTYNRFSLIDTKNISLPFSKNIATLGACKGYSFLGVLGEIAPFDIALGTPYAFQALLLPEKAPVSRTSWESYRNLLKKHGLDSRVWRYYSKRKKEWYLGVRLNMPEGVDFSSTKLLVETLSFFSKKRVTLQPSLNLERTLGSSLINSLVAGKSKPSMILNKMRTTNKHFLNTIVASCLYKPMPRDTLSLA